MKQVIMKSAASTEHLNLDTTKDAEYTDWDELHKFIDAFVTKHVMVFHEAGAWDQELTSANRKLRTDK